MRRVNRRFDLMESIKRSFSENYIGGEEIDRALNGLGDLGFR